MPARRRESFQVQWSKVFHPDKSHCHILRDPERRQVFLQLTAKVEVVLYLCTDVADDAAPHLQSERWSGICLERRECLSENRRREHDGECPSEKDATLVTRSLSDPEIDGFSTAAAWDRRGKTGQLLRRQGVQEFGLVRRMVRFQCEIGVSL